MQIFIAENLRRLRKERGHTQEDLARHIGITVQSVSKWERGEGYPDIEFLPMIAEFYNVSTDDLLGVGKRVREKAVKEFTKKCDELDGEKKYDEEIKLCEKFHIDYPNDETVTRYYMNALRKNGYFDESLELTRILLDNTDDYQTRYEALRNGIMCIAVSFDGDLEESKSYVEKLPDYFTTKNQQLLNVLSGEEIVCAAKDNIEDLMICLCSNIRARQCDIAHDEKQKIKLWKKAVELIDVVCEDGDYGELTEQLLRFRLFIAHDYGLLGEKEKAISELEKCAEIAANYDLSEGGQYTSFLMRGKKYKKGIGARAALFRQMSTWGGFDDIRNDKKFRKVLEGVRCEEAVEGLMAGDAACYNIIGTIKLECEKVNDDIDTSGITEYISEDDITGNFHVRVPNGHRRDVIKIDKKKTTFIDFEEGRIVGVGVVDEEKAEIVLVATEPENETGCKRVMRMMAHCAKYITLEGRTALIKTSPISYGVILPSKAVGFVRK